MENIYLGIGILLLLLFGLLLYHRWNKNMHLYAPGSGNIFKIENVQSRTEAIKKLNENHSFIFFRFLEKRSEHSPFPPFKDRIYYLIEFWE